MKKLVVLLVLIMFAVAVRAANETHYVTVGGKTYFSSSVKVGLTNVRIETENGLTIKAPLKKVDAYMIDGKLCKRLPLYCMDGTEKCTALLELVSFRNGLQLYRLNAAGSKKKFGCCFSDNKHQSSIYIVYKDCKLYLRVDEKNAETVFNFFNIKFQNTI